MDGTGELLTALVDQLSLLRSAQIISFPANRSLGYDDLIAYVAERTPKGRFAILGESFSGPIAIEIAATESRVAGLILASSFARHPIPSLFAPLANVLDLRWVPTKLVEAALLVPRERQNSKTVSANCWRDCLVRLSGPELRKCFEWISGTGFARLLARYCACTADSIDWLEDNAWRRSRWRNLDAKCNGLTLRTCYWKRIPMRLSTRSVSSATG